MRQSISKYIFTNDRLLYTRLKFVSDIVKGKYLIPLIKLLRARYYSSTVLDIGANVGDVTAILLLLGFKVSAFEPSSEAFDILSQRFHQHKKVTLHKLALSDKSKHVHLVYHKDYESLARDLTQCSSIYHKPNLGAYSEQVSAISLIEAIAISENLKTKPIIKIDIEGAEYDLVDDLANHSDIYCKAFVEIHTNIPSGTQKLIDFKKRLSKLIASKKIDLNWH